MEVNIKLSVDAFTAIINLMGETPAKHGFFPLMVDIQKQIEEQTGNMPKERAVPN